MSQKIVQKHVQPDVEYLVAWVSQGIHEVDINIYGNATGLRRLAAMLLKVADYDQSQGKYPDGDTLHVHLSTGLNTNARNVLPRLTLGRVEPKNGAKAVSESFPQLDSSASGAALSDIEI
jgi:hypothetical protein